MTKTKLSVDNYLIVKSIPWQYFLIPKSQNNDHVKIMQFTVKDV